MDTIHTPKRMALDIDGLPNQLRFCLGVEEAVLMVDSVL